MVGPGRARSSGIDLALLRARGFRVQAGGRLLRN
jgi:hypothetical protein